MLAPDREVICSFEVSGAPVAQGSLRAFLVKGRPVVTHDNRRDLGTWRQAVAAAARAGGARPREGPIAIRLTFRLPRPASKPKRVHWPTWKPDIDRLSRAILDALTGVVFRDDAQVVKLTALKAYVEPTTAPTPGVAVTVETLGVAVTVETLG